MLLIPSRNFRRDTRVITPVPCNRANFHGLILITRRRYYDLKLISRRAQETRARKCTSADSAVTARISPLVVVVVSVLCDLLHPRPPLPPVKPTYSVIRFRHFNFIVPLRSPPPPSPSALLCRARLPHPENVYSCACSREGPIGVRARKNDPVATSQPCQRPRRKRSKGRSHTPRRNK